MWATEVGLGKQSCMAEVEAGGVGRGEAVSGAGKRPGGKAMDIGRKESEEIGGVFKRGTFRDVKGDVGEWAACDGQGASCVKGR